MDFVVPLVRRSRVGSGKDDGFVTGKPVAGSMEVLAAPGRIGRPVAGSILAGAAVVLFPGVRGFGGGIELGRGGAREARDEGSEPDRAGDGFGSGVVAEYWFVTLGEEGPTSSKNAR